MGPEWFPLLVVGAVVLAVGTAALGHVVLRLFRLRSRSPFAVGLAGASAPALLTGVAACPLFTLPVLALFGMVGARLLARAVRWWPPEGRTAPEAPPGAAPHEHSRLAGWRLL